jgi:hypothetical protein
MVPEKGGFFPENASKARLIELSLPPPDRFLKMSTRHASRKSIRSSARKSHGSLSKALLLPLPESAVREASLARHLSWAACKKEAGSAYLVNEMVRLVYLTFYVQDAGYGDTDLRVYVQAEAALERCLERAERESVWRFEPDDAPLFEAILRQGDRQLDGVPTYVYMDACERLDRFAVSGRRSPLPSAASMQ